MSNNIFKRALISLTVVILVCLCAYAYAEGGACGPNATWELDENGLLTISGTGEVNTHPWNSWENNILMEKIKKVTVNNGITDICDSAFSDITNVTEIVFSNSVVDIGNWACDDCKSLKKIVLPNSLTYIPGYLCRNDPELESINIPESVTCIKTSAFSNCEKLTQITIPANVVSVEYYAFAGTGISSITIPKGLTEIGTGAFDDCQKLKSINVESGNEKYFVKNGVLYEKDHLITDTIQLHSYPAGKTDHSFVIPSDVNSVASDFSFVSSLSEITFGTNITYIYSDIIGSKQTMLVYDGSYALDYAKKNGVKYKILPKPTPAVIEIVAPTKTMYTYHVGDNETQQLTVRFADGRDDNVKVTDWESSNVLVAYVDWNGEVTAFSKGKAKITATADDGHGNTVKASVTITVKKNTKKVSKVSVDKKKLTLKVGEKYTPVVTLKPATAYANQLKWKSSNKKIAKVNKEGVITAVKKGKAKITVTAESGKKAVITVTVKK